MSFRHIIKDWFRLCFTLVYFKSKSIEITGISEKRTHKMSTSAAYSNSQSLIHHPFMLTVRKPP